MLSEVVIQGLLERFSYKPGWEITYYVGTYEGPHINIRARVENSYRPGEYVDLDVHSPIPPVRDLNDLGEWLAWRLRRLEVHECMEWFKFEGKPWVDPHRPEADQDRDPFDRTAS